MKPVSRKALQQGFFQKMAEKAQQQGLIKLTSAAEREQSWRQILSDNPNPNGDVWVFAYGSLLWNPAFHWIHKFPAQLTGYHRDFNLRTYIGRGCAQQPGLVLGLEPGGVCQGEVLQVKPSSLDAELSVLWSREMVASAYLPSWHRVTSLTETPDQAPVYAICFIMDPHYDHYAGHLSFDQRCHDLSRAQGELGCAADYLFETMAALQAHGIHDELMERYAMEVKRLIGE